MEVKDIESYLSIKHILLDSEIEEKIEQYRLDAVNELDEEAANYFWCLKQIYRVQKQFLSAVSSLKNKKYENAWHDFEQADISLSFLNNNFDTAQGNDKYHLKFIMDITREYQKLFPYRLFTSRETIIKSEKCSICGQPISIRHPCAHKAGKLYMGELCMNVITDIELIGFSIVTDPFDKYAVLYPKDHEYNYEMLDMLMAEIDSPYDGFHVETKEKKKPEYEHVNRNDLCPCGSGEKYKKCHLGTKGELMDCYTILMDNPTTASKPMKIFSLNK